MQDFLQSMSRGFLYSQDLSNCTIETKGWLILVGFLYSQDLSNCTIEDLITQEQA